MKKILFIFALLFIGCNNEYAKIEQDTLTKMNHRPLYVVYETYPVVVFGRNDKYISVVSVNNSDNCFIISDVDAIYSIGDTIKYEID